jgi:hypothetical protein
MEEESEPHLFMTCLVAVEVWIAINAWLELTTVVPGNLFTPLNLLASLLNVKNMLEV